MMKKFNPVYFTIVEAYALLLAVSRMINVSIEDLIYTIEKQIDKGEIDIEEVIKKYDLIDISKIS